MKKKHPAIIAFEDGIKAGKSWKEIKNHYQFGTLEYENWEKGFEYGCGLFNERMEKKYLKS